MFDSESDNTEEDEEFEISVHDNYSITEPIHHKQHQPKGKHIIQPEPYHQPASLVSTNYNAKFVGDEIEDTSTSLHKWVFNLKAKDTSNVYSNQSLIIIRGNSNQLSSKSWKNLTNISSTSLRSYIDEIIIIPRSSYGQMYIVQGLQKSLHFSLGTF